MKIAMITADIKTEAGRGIAVYTQELAEALNNNGIKTDIFYYKRASFFSFLKLFSKIKEYDIIHIQHEHGLFGKFAGIKFIPLLIWLRLYLPKSKIVVTMHTILGKKDELSPKRWYWTFLKRNIIYPIQNRIIGWSSDALIAHSEHLAEILIQDYNINKSKTFVIPHGVKDNVKKFKKNYAKKILNIKGKLFLMIGNIAPQKGFDIILKQAKKIGKTIIIFGKSLDDSYLKELEKIIKYDKLEKFVKIDTEIDPAEGDFKKWRLYLSAADIVLLPYKSMTTSGIFISAMQFGKPVIGSNSSYFRNVASNYNCIEIAKKESDYPSLIKKSLKNFNQMEKEAKRFADEISLNNISKKYKDLYNTI